MKTRSIYDITESSRDYGREAYEEIYEEFLYGLDDDCPAKDEGIPPYESDEYWQFVESLNEEEMISFDNDIMEGDFPLLETPFLITGRIGYYDKQRELQPTIVIGLQSALSYCTEEIDTYSHKLEYENGSLILSTTHHDGRNWFELRILTEEGRKRAQKALKRSKRIRPKDDWFTPVKLDDFRYYGF